MTTVPHPAYSPDLIPEISACSLKWNSGCIHWRDPSRMVTGAKHANTSRLQWVLPKLAKSLGSYTSPRWLLQRWWWKLGLKISIHVITSKFSEILGSISYHTPLGQKPKFWIPTPSPFEKLMSQGTAGSDISYDGCAIIHPFFIHIPLIHMSVTDSSSPPSQLQQEHGYRQHFLDPLLPLHSLPLSISAWCLLWISTHSENIFIPSTILWPQDSEKFSFPFHFPPPAPNPLMTHKSFHNNCYVTPFQYCGQARIWVTNRHGLISQKPWIFSSDAVKYQEILHSYLVTLLPLEGDGIASSEYASGWIMSNCTILGRRKRKQPYWLRGHAASNSVPELFHEVEVAGAWRSHTPSRAGKERIIRVLHGRQRNCHPRQGYFRDDMGGWDVTEIPL